MGWHVRQVAGDPLAAPLLLAMELDEWSMDSASVARQKFALSSLTAGESWKLLTQVLDMDTAEEVRSSVKVFNQYGYHPIQPIKTSLHHS